MNTQENALPPKQLIIGAELSHWATEGQWSAFQHLADQVDGFARSLCEGHLDSVVITHNRLSLAVSCQEPLLAMKVLHPILEQFEPYIPDDYGMAPVFLYCSTEDSPAPQYVSLDNHDHGDWICDECLKAAKEEEATPPTVEKANPQETANLGAKIL